MGFCQSCEIGIGTKEGILESQEETCAYVEALDELDDGNSDGSDDSDLDEFLYPTCLK